MLTIGTMYKKTLMLQTNNKGSGVEKLFFSNFDQQNSYQRVFHADIWCACPCVFDEKLLINVEMFTVSFSFECYYLSTHDLSYRWRGSEDIRLPIGDDCSRFLRHRMTRPFQHDILLNAIINTVLDNISFLVTSAVYVSC